MAARPTVTDASITRGRTISVLNPADDLNRIYSKKIGTECVNVSTRLYPGVRTKKQRHNIKVLLFRMSNVFITTNRSNASFFFNNRINENPILIITGSKRKAYVQSQLSLYILYFFGQLNTKKKFTVRYCGWNIFLCQNFAGKFGVFGLNIRQYVFFYINMIL